MGVCLDKPRGAVLHSPTARVQCVSSTVNRKPTPWGGPED